MKYKLLYIEDDRAEMRMEQLCEDSDKNAQGVGGRTKTEKISGLRRDRIRRQNVQCII